MRVLYSTARLLTVAWAAAVLLVVPAAAQDGANAPLEYPTAAALHNAQIPPRDRVALARELLGVTDIAPASVSAPLREIGERAVFNVTNGSEDRTFQVNAVLRAVGDHSYLWVEDGAAVHDRDVQALADAFDNTIYDSTRALWGSEDTPGIDGDPRVYGLFAHGLGSGTAAYFVSEHTYPVEAVTTSNEHEMFFFNLDALGTSFDLRSTESIVAHEFQHMIRNNLQLNEEYWLNEGFSEFTQLYLYDVPVWEVLSFLGAPGTQLNTWAEANGLRPRNYGASLLFVTYFYDRYGLDALRQLSADPSSRGLQAVDNVLRNLGEPDVNRFFADWVLANYLFDTSIAEGLYGYRSIPTGVVSAVPLDTVVRYPLLTDGLVNQYATDYYVLTHVDDADALNITLSAPATVQLVPTSPYSGQHMWYSNKADVSSTMLTRTFDLTGVETATLNYQVWFHTEQAWDFGYVMASADDGATWTMLSTQHTISDNPHNTAYGPGYTGESGGWQAESVSLDAYAGGEVQLRFQMVTDDAVTQPGMVIDDVSIPEIGYVTDFETDDGGWQADGWVYIDNLLPQQVWVQAVQQVGGEAYVSRWQGPSAASWSLPLRDNVDQVVLAVSPFAPVTTVPMPYSLQVSIQLAGSPTSAMKAPHR